MISRSARWFPVLVIAFAAPAALPADDPKGDPLPKGAKLRLGDGRMAFTSSQSLTLMPPEYKAFVVPDGYDSLRAFDLTTARPLDPAKKPARNFVGSWPVVVSADGKRFAGVHTGPLTVREAATGKEIKVLKPPTGFQTATVYNTAMSALSADGTRLAQGGTGQDNKGRVIVWDVDKGEVFFTATDPITGPAVPVLSPDGKLLAVRSVGFVPPSKPGEEGRREVRVYEVDGGKELFRVASTPGAYGPIAAAVFAPDGSALAASLGDGVVDVWDVKTGKPRAPLLGQTGQGRHLAFSPNGKTIAALSADGAVQRWVAADGKPLGTTDAPAGITPTPLGLVFPDNDRVLVWGAVNSCPVVWEAPSGKRLTTLPEHTAAIKSIAFAAGGKEVLTSGIDGRIVRWDAATGKVLGPVNLRPSPTLARSIGIGGRMFVNLSPDGTRAATTGTPAAVFDLATGSEVFALPRGQQAGHSTTSIPSADLTKVVVVAVPYERAKPTTLAVWDLTARQKLVEVEVPTATGGYPPSAAVSPSGKRLVTTAYAPNAANAPDAVQQTLVVTAWDLKTGKKLAQTEDVTVRGQVFVAAAGDSFAVVSSGGGRLRAFDYESGRGGDEFETGDKFGGGAPSGPVVFSPDGRQFASTGPTAEPGVFAVKVHEWPTGKVLHTFVGHRALVGAMTFSPDGKTLASGAHDSTVLLWDLTAPDPK